MESSNVEQLRPSSDPALVLTNPTPGERRRIWTHTHGMWGSALTAQQYLDREDYLTTVPLSAKGGITHWILTDGTQAPDERPILSSCESIRKPMLASGLGGSKDGSIVSGIGHGIASVFTEIPYRGKGYAGRMLTELGKRLKTWQAEDGRPSLCSVLYSDIGRSFYAKKGWEVFPSTHLSFAPGTEAEEAEEAAKGKRAAAPIGYHELAELCAVDEQLLCERLARLGAATTSTQPHVAIVPSLDAMMWHLMREDYMTKHIFQRTPDVRGAVASASAAESKGHRVWAVWTRGYHGDATSSNEHNTLYILRVVLEDHDDDTADGLRPAHVDGFRSIVALAQAEAARWRCGDVQLWNPTAAVQALAAQAGLAYKLVDREKDSIASLMWYGEGPTSNVDWVANDKYAWC